MRNRTSANPDAIGRTGVHRNVPQASPSADPGMTVHETGTGQLISDVSFDAQRKELVITRTSESIAGLIRGVITTDVTPVVHTIDSPVFGAEEWFPLSGKKIDADKSPLLPDNFSHDDGFGSSKKWVKNLPGGYVWVRLSSGSSPAGSSAWDADNPDYTVSQEPKTVSSPKIIAVTVDSESNLLTMWFDQPLSTNDRLQYKRSSMSVKGRGMGRIRTESGSIKLRTTSSISVILKGSVPLDAQIYVSINKSFWVSKTSKAWIKKKSNIPVKVVSDKNCYVLTRYTRSEEESAAALPAGTVVLLSNPVDVLEAKEDSSDGRDSYSVYSLAPAGAASSDNRESFGQVVGNIIYYRKYSEWGLDSQFNEVEVVDDWSLYMPPDDWDGIEPLNELDPEVPDLPEGLGFVLLNPTSPDIGGYYWQDDSFVPKKNALTSSPTLLEVRIDGVDMYLTFSQPVRLVPGYTPPTLSTDNGASISVLVGGVERFVNIISFVISREITASEVVTFSAYSGLVEDTTTTDLISSEITTPVIIMGRPTGLVIVSNRSVPGAISVNAKCLLQDRMLEVSDSQGVVKKVIDVEPIAPTQEIFFISEGETLPPANITGIKNKAGVVVVDDDPDLQGDRGEGMGVATGSISGKRVMIVNSDNNYFAVAHILGQAGFLYAPQESPGGTVYYSLQVI